MGDGANQSSTTSLGTQVPIVIPKRREEEVPFDRRPKIICQDTGASDMWKAFLIMFRNIGKWRMLGMKCQMKTRHEMPKKEGQEIFPDNSPSGCGENNSPSSHRIME